MTDEGLCRVGWSTQNATLELGMWVGVWVVGCGGDPYEIHCVLYATHLPGKDKFGFGFGGTGKKSYGSQFDSYGEVSSL